MSLVASIRVAVGGFRVEVDVAAAAGETVAVCGPSGSGKTTALRVLAGTLPLDAGRVELDGRVLDDPAAGIFVAPEGRAVGWVPQGSGLFPHLDARDNVAFGLRARGASRRRARAQAETWLERVGLGDRASTWARDLSGGEAQRVALARALAVHPRLVLLDEPFSGLDPLTAGAVRRVLRSAFDAAPAARLLVGHDPVDVLTLADRFVVVEGGRVVQEGTAAELREHPRTAYVAELAGVNVLRGIATYRGGRAVVRGPDGELVVPAAGDGPVLLTFRPTAVALYRDPPSGSPRNVLPGTVVELVPWGERVRVRVDARPPLVAELTAATVEAMALRPGDRVWAVVKATEIEVVPE